MNAYEETIMVEHGDAAAAELAGLDTADAYLGRQPIVDRKGTLVGYELLYRDIDARINDVATTARVILNLLNGVGYAEAIGEFRASINVNAEFLFSDMVEVLAPGRIVLEILETVRATPDLLTRIGSLKACGFTFALDDFTGETPENRAFLDLVDFIKVDIERVPADRLAGMVRSLQRRKALLLAEKVEDPETFERCRQAGFELFQGFHFARPQVLVGKRPDANRAQVLRLLKLAMSDAPLNKLEDELKRVPAITVNVLRMVNSVAAGMRVRTASVREALIRIGRRPLAAWLQLLTYGGGGALGESALFRTAAVRARLMEQIMRSNSGAGDKAEQAFLVGVLSLMPVALDMTPEALAAELDLEEEVRGALVEFVGPMGDLLAMVECFEGGGRDALEKWALDGRWPASGEIMRMELEAQAWAGKLVQDEAPA